jgi:hypothetical protein
MLGESDGFRKLRHAGEKAHGDREGAIRNVCRLEWREDSRRAARARSGRRRWHCSVKQQSEYPRQGVVASEIWPERFKVRLTPQSWRPWTRYP